jgi:DNA-binding beta-propeller fold protein YncE
MIATTRTSLWTVTVLLALLMYALVFACMAVSSVPIAAAAQLPRQASAPHPAAVTSAHATTPRGGVRLTGSPGIPVFDSGTRTLYVPVQCTRVGCENAKASHDVDLINPSHCTNSACKIVAVAKAGVSPFAAAVDDATHTLYVANEGAAEAPSKGKGKGTVSVFDTRHCRAASHSGCHRPLATIHTGGYLDAAAIDRKTRTLYLADSIGSVIAVDIGECTAVNHSQCHRPPHRVKDDLSPSGITIDSKYSTVYASNIEPDKDGNPGHTVSLINAGSCNGHKASSCAQKPTLVGVGATPYWDTVNPRTNSVYVANGNDETVSIINARKCNALSSSGCPETAPTVTTGSGPGFVALDQRLHTVFAVNTDDNTVSALNSRTCRAGAVAACPSLPPSKQAAPDQGSNFVGGPSGAAVDPKTGKMFLTEIGGSVTLAVTNVSTCSAVATSSCRHVAPSVEQADASPIVDPTSHTLYAANDATKTIDLFDTATCTADTPGQCTPVASIPVADPNLGLSNLDDTTHTLYAADPATNVIDVIDISACTASVHTACAAADKASITVVHSGQLLGSLADNPATHTLYATFGPFDASPNYLAEIDTTSCNGEVVSGCDQTPASAPVGPFAFNVAVSTSTNTVYVSNTGFASPSPGHTVSVINGKTCDAAVHNGCAPVATAEVGAAPDGIAVDDSTDSVYVANDAEDDSPGTLSVISSSTCNGTTTTGCATRHPAIGVGREATAVTVGSSDTVYVAGDASAGISAVDVSSCNGETTAGCGRIAPLRPTGSEPNGIAVDTTTHTIFVTTNGDGGGISVLRMG